MRSSRLKKSRGRLIVVSAPSGAGKTTLCRRLLRRRKNLMFSISATTRLPRPGERDGREYFFVSEPAFRALLRRGALVEWARVHGQYYGTPRAFLDRHRAAGKDVLLDIDVQGAMQVRRLCPEAILIFIMPPSLEELERRLRGRSSENEAQLQRRLSDARRELRLAGRYDYRVVNDAIPAAVKALNTILDAKPKSHKTNQGE